MPQEPEKKIEELLKAYGRKRREDSGAPLEIHPATRKLLQAEVARLHPKPASRSASWFHSLIQFWPRIAVAISIVIALGVIVWMLGLENRKSAEFAQAARKPATEIFSRDESMEKDVALKREIADNFSAAEQKTKSEVRAEKALEESIAGRPKAPATVNDEVTLADASKRYGKEMKLKEAAGGKSDQPAAPSQQLANALPPSSSAPVTDQPKNAPVLDSAAPITQTLELARKPIGAAQGFAGGGGAAAQNRPGDNLARDKADDSKATRADSLGLLLAPVVTTNAVVAYSVNGTAIIRGAYNYSLQDSSGFSIASSSNMANDSLFQPVLPMDISTNLSLFADGRANTPTLFQQNKNQAWNEPPTLNKKVPELRAADSGSLTLARSGERLKQQPEVAKEPVATFGVDKDRDGLRPQGQSTNVQRTAWHFLAEGLEPGQAGKEVETAAAVPSTEQLTERLRSYRAVTKSGAASGPLAASAVLNSFQVDLNGDRIRLTDADGSVYEGQLAARNEERARKVVEIKPTSEASRRLQDAEKEQETLGRREAQTSSNGELEPASFRVTGTNRSLNQLVVVDAILSAPAGSRDEAALGGLTTRLRILDSRSAATEPAPTASPSPATPQPPGAVAPQKAPATRTAGRQSIIIPTMKIQGKARIGGTNEISINAIRVAP